MLNCQLLLIGLMCKPMLVTVPFGLLLLDYWPLARLRFSPEAVAPKRSPNGAPGQAGKR